MLNGATGKKMMRKEDRNVRIKISVTEDFEKSLKEKAAEYDLKPTTLCSFLEYVGYFSLLKMEEQIKQINDDMDVKEIIGRIANNQDINIGYELTWSVKVLRSAVKELKTEQILINGLDSLRKLSRQASKKEYFKELSKIEYKGVKHEA